MGRYLGRGRRWVVVLPDGGEAPFGTLQTVADGGEFAVLRQEGAVHLAERDLEFARLDLEALEAQVRRIVRLRRGRFVARRAAGALWYIALFHESDGTGYEVSLTSDEVGVIARLARLGIDSDQVDGIAAELSRVLELFDALGAIDTEGVEPMAHPLDVVARLRDDAVTEPDRRAALQAPAPVVRDGWFVVPRVIE